MRVAVSGGLLLGFLLFGGVLAGMAVQAHESAPSTLLAPPPMSIDTPTRESRPLTPPYGLIAPGGAPLDSVPVGAGR